MRHIHPEVLSQIMNERFSSFLAGGPAPADEECRAFAPELSQLSGAAVHPRSVSAAGGALFFLAAGKEGDLLGAVAKSPVEGFEGEVSDARLGDVDVKLLLGPTSAKNAAALRGRLPFLNPQPLGLQKSAGCGDRLGLATPGHIRALRAVSPEGGPPAMALICAQQSIRENARTGRTPQQVMDDAMWGVFREGWRFGFGADADHLKTKADVESCAAAGYTFFTFDPGEHVENEAERYDRSTLLAKAEALPWDALESTLSDATRRFTANPVDLGSFSVQISEEAVLRALVKYGRAVAHIVSLYRHLQSLMGTRPFEVEVSVDETESVTTIEEHIYIASELKRLGVRWVSLAPRYVGRFEKGVDYIGDLGELRRNFEQHFAVSQAFGPYKLSLHSGSDKFSVYPIAAEVAGEYVHLKTAGTSYLEAVRAVALLNPELFRQIMRFALGRYDEDRATYHVSADAAKVPDVSKLGDAELPGLLEDFHARQVLHVTFGSVLSSEELSRPFFDTLRGNLDTYHEVLEKHFVRHMAPLCKR